jgi:hypothetical protein
VLRYCWPKWRLLAPDIASILRLVHVTAFEALSLSLGSSAKSLAHFFESCRRKRNEIDYDRAFVASQADADEIIRRARELELAVEGWITAHHSKLAK